MAAAIDARTGLAIWLPVTVCCWDGNVVEPLEYRRDSRLLIVHGGRNEPGKGTSAYVLDESARWFRIVGHVEE